MAIDCKDTSKIGNTTKCGKCKEKVNLLNAYVFLGPSWIRWVCPKCNYEFNYENIKT